MVGSSDRRMVILHSAFCILHYFGGMAAWSVLFALLAASWCICAAAPGPETHLFRAELPNREMAVFLPERDISSREDAAAYLRWARESHPAWASRMRAVWASDPVALPVHWQNEAALLREGDSAVDSAGAIHFRVTGLPENGRFRVRLETEPAAGTATPELCLTNIWVLSRDDLFARWRKALATSPDTAPAEVRGQIKALATSGRYARRGGAIWEAAVEDFRTNTPALWPRIRFENHTDVAIAIVCQGATITNPPGAARTVAVRTPANEILWAARLVPPPPFVAEEYEWTTNSVLWRRSASSDSVLVFDAPPGKLKPLPRLRLTLPEANRPMPAGLRAIIRYKEGGEEITKTIQAYEVDGIPFVEIAPHLPLTGIALEADGYERTVWHSWTDRAEHVLICGKTLKIPFPNPLSPVKKEVAHPSAPPPTVPSAPPPTVPSAPPPTVPSAPPPTVPSDKTHPIVPWPGAVRQASVPPWPWESLRQQIRMRVWWTDWKAIDTGQTNDDYDRNAALKQFDDLLQGRDERGEFQKAYLHVASCKGCASCNAHRKAMMCEEGFVEQRWALFQSLLLNSGTDWTDFTEAPNAARIGKLRKLLEEKEKGKEKRK